MHPLVELSPRVQKIAETLTQFVEHECIPAERIYHAQTKVGADRWKYVPPVIEELKVKARSLGLWNFFLPKYYKEGPGFTNLEYAVLCEIIGRSHLAPEVE
jgi:acyl-CoA dehydrogenase